MPELEFYFDYLSPYAYLASHRVRELCERRGLSLRFRPVLFPAILEYWGQRGPAEIPPKAVHAFRDCMRYALLHRIPLRAPRYHPFNPLPALRASLSEVSGAAQAQVVSVLYRFGWAQGGDLGDPGALTGALDGAGLDGAGLIARAREPRAKALLRDQTARAAEQRGVFGVPSVWFRDQLFWGLDQLPAVELVAEGRDPLEGVDWDAVRPLGPAAWRPGVPRPEGA